MAAHQEQAFSFYDTPARTMASIPCAPDREVTMYTCGPTVYKDAHIGNMRAYVTADLTRRAINLAGSTVRQVINITDVGHLASDADTGEDKVAASAREQGMSAWEVAQLYESRFWADAEALRVAQPEVVARATEHIDEQIELVAKLEKRGFTYQTPDGVYFDSSKYPEYGDFAKLDVGGLQSGQRVDMGNKRNPHDFALWKFPSKVGVREMEWKSPWGVGFPGWHVECSAMAVKHLGDTFDIHTGGIDHIPIHHTNEIAQARAAGYPFADHWMHTAFLVNDGGEKMSKSSGASSRVPDILTAYDIPADGLRYMYLTQHYRSPLVFNAERVEQARTSHDRMLDTATVLKHTAAHSETTGTEPSEEAKRVWTEFATNMLTDLNTPGALDVVHKMLKSKRLSPAEKTTLLASMDRVLGLGVESSASNVELTKAQAGLIAQRGVARAAQAFGAADTIRETLRQQGVRIIDSPSGEQLVRRTG